MSPMRNASRAISQLGKADQVFSVQRYTVDHVDATVPTVDGQPAVFLDCGGPEPLQAPYPDTVTGLAAGQLVDVLLVNSSPRILGRFVGISPSS